MDKTVKAILLDLGNVIIKLNPSALEEGYSHYGDAGGGRMTEFIMKEDSEILSGYMEGKLTSSQFYKKVSRLFNMDISFDDFYRVWNGMFLPYPEMENLIRLTREKYPEVKLILVSNTNEAHYDFIRQNYKILDLLDECVVSHEFGKQKPDNSIYNEALRISGTLPKETFYTDDRLDLIDAARAMGIRAFQFTGHEEFQEKLEKFGLIL